MSAGAAFRITHQSAHAGLSSRDRKAGLGTAKQVVCDPFRRLDVGRHRLGHRVIAARDLLSDQTAQSNGELRLLACLPCFVVQTAICWNAGHAAKHAPARDDGHLQDLPARRESGGDQGMTGLVIGGQPPVFIADFRDAVLGGRVDRGGGNQPAQQHQHRDAADVDLGNAESARHSHFRLCLIRASHPWRQLPTARCSPRGIIPPLHKAEDWHGSGPLAEDIR